MRFATIVRTAIFVLSIAAVMSADLARASSGLPRGVVGAAPPSAQTWSYGRLPLQFEPNEGQTDKHVKFLTHGCGQTLFLTGSEAVLCLTRSTGKSSGFDPRKAMALKRPDRSARVTSVLRMRVAGANTSAPVAGVDKLTGKVNYFIGNDPKKWHANIPTYRKVAYRDVYKGIDLVYYGNDRSLEYDFVVKPGGVPSKIALSFTGAKHMRVTAAGDLALNLGPGEILWKKPVVYQQDAAGHRTPVAGCYVLAAGGRAVRFAVARYDARRPLTIDPVLTYSTYLGGSGQDMGSGITVDAAGCAYATGQASSTNFPVTAGPFQNWLAGPENAYVTKVNAAGTGLLYSTYLGGSGGGGEGDRGEGISVDGSGCAYLTGQTPSSDFPVTAKAFQKTIGGGINSSGNAFVTKLNAAGSDLLYSTYLGGNGMDSGNGIAVDGAGCAYLTGYAGSTNFPVTAGAFQRTIGSPYNNAFVTKMNASGSGLLYSTYLGGSGGDYGEGIAVDASGYAYVAGWTLSTNFPVTAGVLQKTVASNLNAFVTKVNAAGSALLYSTYLGATNNATTLSFDYGNGISVDGSGCAYVTGNTGPGFPVTAGAFQKTIGGAYNAFVAKLNAAATALMYSTYLGGSGGASGNGIAVDSSGCAYVTGNTGPGFPVTAGTFQKTIGGAYNAFVTKLNMAGSSLVCSTYLGGTGSDDGSGIAVDGSGCAYVTGNTGPGFPVTAGAFQTNLGGSYNAFVTKLNMAGSETPGSTYALWNNSGTASLWKIPPSGAITSAAFGPYSGWTAVALASDTNGNAYILWTNSAGGASIFKIAPNLTLTTSESLGPYTGWAAKTLAVGPDGNIRVLWNHTADNEVSIFNIALGSSYTTKTYGPIAGWQAIQIAVDSGNSTRILWNDAALGEASLWNISSAGVQTTQTFGPYSGWQAQSFAITTGGQPRIVWENTATKQTSIFTIATNGAFTSQSLGPYTGWAPAGLAVNGNGDSNLMWNSTSNQLSIFDIGSTGSVTSSAYGPISGWKAIAIAPGP